MTALLGIDIGTSSCKAMAFNAQNGAVLAESVAEYELFAPQKGWAQQNPADWWASAVKAVRSVLENVRASDIAAVGVAGQSWACVAVDSRLNPLLPTPIWMDTRASAEAQNMIDAVGAKKLMQVAGNMPAPGHSGPKTLWFLKHFPSEMKRAAALLQSNGFIVAKLTGALTQDKSQGYGWACYDMQNAAWNEDLGRAMGLPVGLLPQIRGCHEVVGAVTAEAASLTGLLQGTPVVAGGLDAACGTLGAGVISAGQTQEQGGNAGGFSACTEKPISHEKLILSAHVVPDRWLLQGGTVGGAAAASWLRRMLGKPSYSDIDAAANAVPAGARGVTFLPYLSGERSPIWDPNACGVFFGLSLSTGQAEVWRALLEAVAFSLRHNLDTAAEAGLKVGTLRAVGGAARSEVWTQIKADVTGRRVEVARPGSATAQGAAMLAGMGVGAWPSFEAAAAQTTCVERVHEPSTEHAAQYEAAYQRYRQLYPALRDIMNNGGVQL